MRDLRTPRWSDARGVSLLEVMIALVILTVALLVLLNMAIVAIGANDWSNRTTVAVQLMQQKIEQLKTEPAPTDGSDTVNTVVRTWTVTSEGDYLRKVRVAVDWEDVAAVQHTTEMTTFIRTDSL